MPDLYTVSFTTRKLVNVLDKKGNVVEQKRLDTPITLEALPRLAAESYSKCDNFKMVAYVPQHRGGVRSGVASAGAVGNGSRKRTTRVEAPASAATASTESATQRAARTGDLSRALN